MDHPAQTIEIPQGHIISGPVPEGLLNSLQATDSANCGASAFFLGMIRADQVNGKQVSLMDYSSYIPMAERIFKELIERLIVEHQLADLHIYHSVGAVMAGQTSLLVFVRSVHRKAVFTGLMAAVEAVKAEAPVWKREVFEDGSYRWV